MVSIKTKYGLSVVFNLAMQPKDSLITIKALSETCHVPKKYLEQILNALRKSNIVKSVRGTQGGYTLSRSANEITVYDIAFCLEQSLLFSEGYNGGSVLELCWKDIDLMVKSSFNISIASLIKKHLQSKQYLSFAI